MVVDDTTGAERGSFLRPQFLDRRAKEVSQGFEIPGAGPRITRSDRAQNEREPAGRPTHRDN